MEITITNQDAITTAVLSGRLDTPAAVEHDKTFQKLSEYANGKVVLDCKELSYISSSGLRLFLSLRKAAAAAGGEVIIKDITDGIRQIFMMTGFLNLFTIE